MKKRKILIATYNKNKAKEIKLIFKDSDFEPIFLFEKSEAIKLDEVANSFEGNALIKAIIAGEHFKQICLADDSGLCIDYLHGAPGVRSARFSQSGRASDNNDLVLNLLKDVCAKDRSAYFTTHVAIYNPLDKLIKTTYANWSGRINNELKGDKSFGYAPLFAMKEYKYQKTAGEFENLELIKYNHRGQAFNKALVILNKYFNQT